MVTLKIHIEDSEKEAAVRTILDALHIPYEDETGDETAYLKSSPAMAEHLNKSIEQANRGEGKKITLDQISPK